MTDPTTRELITDLLAALKSWSPTGGGPLEGAEEQYEAALIAKAEAFLDQPEPEGLTDEPLGDLIDKWVQEAFRKKPYGCTHPTHTYVACKAFEHGRNHAARTALDQPEPEGPVPVSERLPKAEDCDAQGNCWLTNDGMEPGWVLDNPEKCTNWTHWVPHWAMPVATK